MKDFHFYLSGNFDRRWICHSWEPTAPLAEAAPSLLLTAKLNSEGKIYKLFKGITIYFIFSDDRVVEYILCQIWASLFFSRPFTGVFFQRIYSAILCEKLAQLHKLFNQDLISSRSDAYSSYSCQVWQRLGMAPPANPVQAESGMYWPIASNWLKNCALLQHRISILCTSKNAAWLVHYVFKRPSGLWLFWRLD